MNIGDLVRFTLRGTLLGQATRNVFYYLIDDMTGAPTLGEMTEDFATVVLAALLPLTNHELTYAAVDAFVLAESSEFATYTIPDGQGDVEGSCHPPFVAWGFRYNRASGQSRHGYKRFAGVDLDAADNGVPAVGLATAIAALETALEQDVSVSGSLGSANLTPRIVSFTLNGQPRATPVDFPIASVEFVSVTTQNTRKFGRGL